MASNLLLSAVPLARAQDQEINRWAPLVVRLVGTVLVTAAALSTGPRRRAPRAGATPVRAYQLLPAYDAL